MSLVALGIALIDAVKSGERVVVESLLDAGADPNTVDLFDGLTALQLAQKDGHVEIAQLLQAKGALPIGPSPSDESESDGSPTREALLEQIAGMIASPGAEIAACLGASGMALAGQVETMAKKGRKET